MRSAYFFLLRLLPLVLMVFSPGCKPAENAGEADPYGHIADPEAAGLLKKAIARAGGLEAWNGLQELHFGKYTALFDASGAVEREDWQENDYTFHPEERFRIGWVAGSAAQEMVYYRGQVSKTIEGEPDTTTGQQSLLDAVRSASFVISIPFKLLDEGVNLTYAGPDTLEDGRIVEVLRAAYDPAEHEQHSTPDTWWHFFDREDHRLVAYLVRHADHYSYVKNLRDTTVSGFLFPTERESYRVDSLRNIQFLRAKYAYTDYRVAF